MRRSASAVRNIIFTVKIQYRDACSLEVDLLLILVLVLTFLVQSVLLKSSEKEPATATVRL